jgi:hypothetical protein
MVPSLAIKDLTAGRIPGVGDPASAFASEESGFGE